MGWLRALPVGDGPCSQKNVSYVSLNYICHVGAFYNDLSLLTSTYPSFNTKPRAYQLNSKPPEQHQERPLSKEICINIMVSLKLLALLSPTHLIMIKLGRVNSWTSKDCRQWQLFSDWVSYTKSRLVFTVFHDGAMLITQTLILFLCCAPYRKSPAEAVQMWLLYAVLSATPKRNEVRRQARVKPNTAPQ